MDYSAYFVKLTLPTAQCIILILGRYVTDILKMCIKYFNAEKYILTNLQHFELSQFLTNAYL